MPSVYIIGDCHSQFNFLNGLLNYTIDLNDPFLYYVIQVGDFGYFPKLGLNPGAALMIPDKCLGVYFVSGNHDDHSILKNFSWKDGPIELAPKLHYCPFGTVKTFGSSTFGFFGGALSPDMILRHPGFDYFENEEISQKEMDSLPESLFKTTFDYFISHTCPKSQLGKLVGKRDQYPDQSTDYLQKLWERMNVPPKNWVFGHFHVNNSWVDKGTRFTVLDQVSTLVKEECYIKVEV